MGRKRWNSQRVLQCGREVAAVVQRSKRLNPSGKATRCLLWHETSLRLCDLAVTPGGVGASLVPRGSCCCRCCCCCYCSSAFHYSVCPMHLPGLVATPFFSGSCLAAWLGRPGPGACAPRDFLPTIDHGASNVR